MVLGLNFPAIILVSIIREKARGRGGSVVKKNSLKIGKEAAWMRIGKPFEFYKEIRQNMSAYAFVSLLNHWPCKGV
jgi:hypothetical protein